MIEISTNRDNGFWYISPQGMRAIITGKVIWRKCYSCEEGRQWVDGDIGIVVDPSVVDKSEDPDIYYQDTCDDCQGVGFVYVALND